MVNIDTQNTPYDDEGFVISEVRRNIKALEAPEQRQALQKIYEEIHAAKLIPPMVDNMTRGNEIAVALLRTLLTENEIRPISSVTLLAVLRQFMGSILFSSAPAVAITSTTVLEDLKKSMTLLGPLFLLGITERPHVNAYTDQPQLKP